MNIQKATSSCKIVTLNQCSFMSNSHSNWKVNWYVTVNSANCNYLSTIFKSNCIVCIFLPMLSRVRSNYGSLFTRSSTELLYLAIRSLKWKKKNAHIHQEETLNCRKHKSGPTTYLLWFSNCSLSSTFCFCPSTVYIQHPQIPKLKKETVILTY